VLEQVSRRRRIPFGYFFIGRDLYRCFRYSLCFGVLPRKHAQEGEISHHLTGHISFDWLPMRWIGGINSSAWTGRDKELRFSRSLCWIGAWQTK
jgi:hypothetical protein